MTAVELLQLLAQVTWVAIGAITIVRAVRLRTRSSVDIAAFFGALALVTIEGRVVALLDVPFEEQIRTAALFVVMAIPYLLLRVMRGFGSVGRAVMRAAQAGLAASLVLIAAVGVTNNVVLLYLVLYFAALSIYSAARAVALSATTFGVTRQRMRAVAAASYFLGVVLLIAGIGVFVPAAQPVTGALTQVGALCAAIAYAIGFVPPNELRKYWQIPEFRAFVGRSAVLPRESLAEIADDVAAAAGRALGARGAIGLWDGAAGVLRFREPLAGLPTEVGPSALITWIVFERQRPMYVPDAAEAVPDHAAAYRRAGIGPILAAPITAGDRRLGVLAVYSSREPIFAEEDLAFVELMAQQAAVVLEGRQLIDDAARVRAAEESARLKEDFVSAAAHDLKTPLTTITAQAQLMERHALREGRTDDLPGIRRLVRETAQLARLVEEILDASRLERGALPMQPEPGDLAAIAREVAARERTGAERVELVADGTVRGMYDPDRIRQLIDNLVENALKYSPAESPVEIRVWLEGSTGRIAVTDRGIGIPPEDMPYVFDRFRRGSNVDHRRFSGIGLGLYICRGIVEQHGGRVWVESATGRGTTFHVALPLAAEPERPAGDATMVTSG